MVTAPSKPYGTSTPGVLCPSARVYSTWYRLMVTSLLLVGATEKSFDVVLSTTNALSLVLVPTCETRGPALLAPDGARELITRYMGELPCRTTSPQETLAETIAASPIKRMRVPMS